MELERIIVLMILKHCLAFAKETVAKVRLAETPGSPGSNSVNYLYKYGPPAAVQVDEYHEVHDLKDVNEHEIPNIDSHHNNQLQHLISENPLAGALFISTALGIPSKLTTLSNHPAHFPINPYIALLLSHYGKYRPIYGRGYGLYSYGASNNYHNNKPFGSYKIYEDTDS